MRVLPLIAAAFLAAPVAANGLMQVPSGQVIVPYEFLWEDHMDEGVKGEAWLILRFLTPEIARANGRIKFEAAEKDIEVLCTKVGLPLVAQTGAVNQIIVNLMDKPLARGDSDPEVTQFLGAFRVETGTCEWTY